MRLRKAAALAALQARIAAELAGGTIPISCGHPVTAERLSLPSRILACEDRIGPLAAGDWYSAPVSCSCCGQLASGGSTWMHGRVLVMERLCESCNPPAAATWSDN